MLCFRCKIFSRRGKTGKTRSQTWHSSQSLMCLEVNANDQTWLEKLVFILNLKKNQKGSILIFTCSMMETGLKFLIINWNERKDCRISRNFMARRCDTKQGVKPKDVMSEVNSLVTGLMYFLIFFYHPLTFCIFPYPFKCLLLFQSRSKPTTRITSLY